MCRSAKKTLRGRWNHCRSSEGGASLRKSQWHSASRHFQKDSEKFDGEFAWLIAYGNHGEQSAGPVRSDAND